MEGAWRSDAAGAHAARAQLMQLVRAPGEAAIQVLPVDRLADVIEEPKHLLRHPRLGKWYVTHSESGGTLSVNWSDDTIHARALTRLGAEHVRMATSMPDLEFYHVSDAKAVHAFDSSLRATPAGRARRQRWEYKLARINLDADPLSVLEKEVNEALLEGWQLVGAPVAITYGQRSGGWAVQALTRPLDV